MVLQNKENITQAKSSTFVDILSRMSSFGYKGYRDITICEKRLSQLPIGDIHFVGFCADKVLHNDDIGPPNVQINPVNTSEFEIHSCVTLPEPALYSTRQIETIAQDVIREDHGDVS